MAAACNGGGLGGASNPSDARPNLSPFLSVDGDSQISIALRARGTLRARYQNGSGAEVVGTVKCEISDGDAKGSRLNDDGVMKAGGSDLLELVVVGGGDETTFKVTCTSGGVGSIEYTVLVGIPDLKGLYQIETKLGYGSQLPGFVNKFVDGLSCWKDEGKSPYQCTVRLIQKTLCPDRGLLGVFCSLAVQLGGAAVANWTNVEDWVDEHLGGETMRGVGYLADHFKKMMAQHRFITEINIVAGDEDGEYEARHRFVKAYCEIDGAEFDGTPVAEGRHREWSNVDDFEAKFDRDSGKVTFDAHEVYIPYKKVVEGCIQRATAWQAEDEWGYETSDTEGYFAEKVCDRTGGWGDVCEFVVKGLMKYVENSIKDADDDDLEVESGEAEPRLSGGGKLTVRAFTDGKWKITQPYKTTVDFRGRRTSDEAETTTSILP